MDDFVAILLEKWSPANKRCQLFFHPNCLQQLHLGDGSLLHSRYVMIQFIIQFLPLELPHCSEGLDVQETVAQTHVAAARGLFFSCSNQKNSLSAGEKKTVHLIFNQAPFSDLGQVTVCRFPFLNIGKFKHQLSRKYSFWNTDTEVNCFQFKP